MDKIFRFGNIIALVVTIFINYLSNTGIINNRTIGEVSSDYPSLFTPAGYTFSIWGLIYLLLIGFVIYQSSQNTSKKIVKNIGIWFILSCLANISWVFLWLYGYVGISCIAMLFLLFCLIKIVLKKDIVNSKVSKKYYIFRKLPFTVYAGWISVAIIANVSTYLLSIRWDGFGISPLVWTILMISIATILNILVLYLLHLPEFAMVAVWAYLGIAVKNWNNYFEISYFSLIAATILFILIGIQVYKNWRNYSIFN